MQLQIEGVSKRYTGSDFYALRDLSLDIGPGILGVLGPNGASKSTLMRIIATITKPTHGTVRWNGIDITQQPDEIRMVLGFGTGEGLRGGRPCITLPRSTRPPGKRRNTKKKGNPPIPLVIYKKNGGYGYAQILKYIVPELKYQGVTKTQLKNILIKNPKRMLVC